MSRHQTTGQNYDIKIANIVFENVAKFKYLGTVFAKKFKSRLNSANACYRAVQNHLSSLLLPKNIKIKKQKPIILLLFCVGVNLASDVK
jgi:hypothetical protein